MGYTISVTGDSVEDLRQAVASLGGAALPVAVTTGTIAPATPEKKGPGRPAKATAAGKSAADMAAEMGLLAPTPAAAAPAAPAVPAFTEEQVRAKLAELMAHRTGDADETVGMLRVQAVLAKVGAQQIKAVSPARYGELVQYIEAA